jgi:hypothetical protein
LFKSALALAPYCPVRLPGAPKITFSLPRFHSSSVPQFHSSSISTVFFEFSNSRTKKNCGSVVGIRRRGRQDIGFTTANCGKNVGTAPLYIQRKWALRRSRNLPCGLDKVENVELWNRGSVELWNRGTVELKNCELWKTESNEKIGVPCQIYIYP